MPSITWDINVWGADANISLFGNDELGLITVTTGTALPAAPAGFLFTVFQDSFYNIVSSKPFAVLSPANKAAQELPAGNLTLGITPNSFNFRIYRGSIPLTPNTTYLWVYHIPKH